MNLYIFFVVGKLGLQILASKILGDLGAVSGKSHGGFLGVAAVE